MTVWILLCRFEVSCEQEPSSYRSRPKKERVLKTRASQIPPENTQKYGAGRNDRGMNPGYVFP